jgi:two-component system nitrate/nitrite response regulator NarL
MRCYEKLVNGKMGGPVRVRVLVADDHPLYRDGIARAITTRPDLELVGKAGDGRDALVLIQELVPDVAVVDLSMPSLSGLQVVTAMTDLQLPTRALVVSGHAESERVYDAIAAGARGYLLKDVDRTTICDAIMRVARGGTVFSPHIHDGIAEQIRAHRHDPRPTLTPREQEILAHAAEGRSGPEIARLLYLSPATVKTHLANIYDKLGVSDRAAAVAKALREGVLQ